MTSRKGKVVIPGASVVRGRIRRLERSPVLKSEDFGATLGTSWEQQASRRIFA
jgi:hypothetical protein